MEPSGDASPSSGPEAVLGVSGAEPGTDPGWLPVLPVGAPASGNPGSQASVRDTDPKGELTSDVKIPNRDSDIDSPSCSLAGEPFPGEEGGPPSMYPDSDVEEGSGEEPDPENSPSQTSKANEVDLAKVGPVLAHTPGRGPAGGPDTHGLGVFIPQDLDLRLVLGALVPVMPRGVHCSLAGPCTPGHVGRHSHLPWKPPRIPSMEAPQGAPQPSPPPQVTHVLFSAVLRVPEATAHCSGAAGH